MRIILIVFILIFNSQSWTKADDIRDFEIEGMSIGDSALNFFSETDIKKNSKNYFKKKNYTPVQNDDYDFFKIYDAVDFIYKTNDSNYKIVRLSGILSYVNNIKDCYPKMKEISNGIKLVVGNKVRVQEGNEIHRGDPTGKSKFSFVYFIFSSGETINISCYDYSKEDGGQDHLSVTFNSKESRDFFLSNPYEPY